MIQLRELQNIISHNCSSASGSPQPSPNFQISGALWDLIQLIGETARGNTVLLIDRDNAEVFYTKVFELQQVFDCLGRHNALLDSLYKQIFNVGSEEPNTETLRKLSLNLLSIAKRHEGYNTMWKIFCDLNDFELLRHLMNKNMGPKGGFSYFVFKGLYVKKQFSKLLRLGEEFQEELCIFLKDLPNLLWLHELFLHQFASASETLHRLALSQNGHLGPEAEEGVDPEPSTMAMMLSNRKHLLNLSKIAAMVGKDTDYKTDVKRIEADLKILKLQEAILGVLGANEAMQDDGQQLLRPEDLIELCIKADNPEQALWVFDMFAWTSSSFCRSNRRLLEECWKNAADQDD